MFQITLKAARELSGYSEGEVAKHCGISEKEYRIIEIDPSQAKLSLMLKISAFLGLALGLIFPGNTSDCLDYNRSQSKARKSCSQFAHAFK